MQKLDKIKQVAVQDQQTEIDPRSKTTADKAYNQLAQENLKCQLADKKECLLKREETQRRTNGLVQFGKNSHASWRKDIF